jgi:hypothetical protein
MVYIDVTGCCFIFYIDVAVCYCMVYVDVADCYCIVYIDVADCYCIVYIDVAVCYCSLYRLWRTRLVLLGKRVKGISKKKKTTELINKSNPKNKLNRYTGFFRSFAGNEITPVDSSLICIITRTVRHTTIALHSLFVSMTTLVKHHCCPVLHFWILFKMHMCW